MAEALETRALAEYAGRPENYLNDWARRTGNLEDFDQYAVEVTQDAHGYQWASIVEKSAVAETSTRSYNHNADAPAEPAKASGRRKAKTADKSVFD
jgi:hypothetical protein